MLAAMNSRERIEAAFTHSAPDRTPIFEYELQSPLADAFIRRQYLGDCTHWASAVEEMGFAAAVRQQAIDRLDLAQALGHDMMYVPPPARPQAGQKLAFDMASTAAALDGDPAERVQTRNQRLESEELRLPEERLFIYACLGEEMRRRDMDLPILAPAYAHGIWADTDLMMTMAIAPEVAHEHFALCTRQSTALAKQYLDLGLNLIGVGGDFAGDRPLISPEAYKRFIVPEVAKVSRYVHERGGRAINASDGNLWSVIDAFLVGCEVDGYIEIDYRAGMDLRNLKARYGGTITFLGNVDCSEILSFAKPHEVYSHTREVVEAGLGNGGHILTASNAVMASVPLENYMQLLRAYRDCFGIGWPLKWA